jgi:dienelactone hydrolase
MTDVPGFASEEFTHDGATRRVFRRGQGPAVVVMHEVPGITPPVAKFATRVADAGFSVYMPLMLGTPMRPVSGGYIASSVFRACISKEFRVLGANQSSPIIDWLRALARHAHALHGGPGVGAIGMCLTGNFALAMMLDSPTLAPVLSQPSLPFPVSKAAKSALHASPKEIAAAHEKIDKHGAKILGLRFHGDPACPAERFERLRQEFGAGFEGIEIDAKHGKPGMGAPHSVVTNHLIDEEGEPTRAALDRVLSFFKEQLAPAL